MNSTTKWILGIVAAVVGTCTAGVIGWSMLTTSQNQTDIAVIKAQAVTFATGTDVADIKGSITGLERDVRQLTNDNAKLSTTTETLVQLQQDIVRNQDRTQMVLEEIKASKEHHQ